MLSWFGLRWSSVWPATAPPPTASARQPPLLQAAVCRPHGPAALNRGVQRRRPGGSSKQRGGRADGSLQQLARCGAQSASDSSRLGQAHQEPE
jgi:hypothetical protein